nr:hypothetical protein [Tanacetum cinerariifolium]
MDFISLAKHNSRNKDGNTACVPTASTNVPTASANVATISQDTTCAYIASQSSGSQIKFEDINQIDEDDMEEMDIKWNMALLSMREDNFWKKIVKKISIQGSDVAGFDKSKAPKALMVIDGVEWDWSYMTNDEEDHASVAPTEFALIANTSTASKTLKLEKDRVDGKLAGLLKASKDLDNLIESQRNPSVSENIASPITHKPFIKFVKPKDSQSKSKTGKTVSPKKPPVKYVEQYRKPNKKPNVRGNQRNWNNLKSHQLGPDFVIKKKACFNCGDFNRLAYDCRKRVKKSFIPKPVAHRPSQRPVRTNMNGARPNRTSFNKQAHSYANRLFHRTSAGRSHYRAPWVPTVNRNFPPVNRKFPTASRKFPTSSTKCSIADMGIKRKAGNTQNNIDDKGYWDNGCSRHMTGNISYLYDYEPFDGGYVSFGQGGCKITGKWTIKTGKLEFENVYYVKDLKYNLFSVSQIYDNKNSVLFTDLECIVLRRDFKLLDDANILLRTPRQHNMYSIDLNNIVSHRDLTCLDLKVKIIRCDNGAEFRNKEMNDFCSQKGIKREFSNARTPQQNGTISTNLLGTKDAASQEVKKDISSLRYIALPNWAHDALLEFSSSKPQDHYSIKVPEVKTPIPTVSSPVPTAYSTDSQELSSNARLVSKRVANQEEKPSLDNILSLINRFEDILRVTTNSDESNRVEADIIEPKKISDALQDPSWVEAMQEELLQFKIQNVWTLVDCPKGVRPIGTKWVLKNKKDKRGIVIRNKAKLVAQGYTQEEGIDYDEVFAPVARIKAIRLFLAYASFMGFTIYQMDVKSAFLYGTIDEEVYVMQPPGFQDPEFPAKVYKVEKAMGTIDQSLFIRKQREDFILVKKKDGIFLSQDKYAGDILKKFEYSDVRDCFEKKLISMDYIHTDENVANLLTKPFDAGRFQYLVVGTSKYWGVLRILMISLRLIPLSKHNADFHPMVDFIEASPLRIETTDEGTQILATVDGIHRTVTESSLRRNLKLQDEEGISSLHDMELFENLTLMGYNISPNQKFTFQKGLFPFLILCWYNRVKAQDRATIDKSSTLPHDSASKVTSLAAVEGKLTAKFQAQEVEINRLKERVKLLEDKEGVTTIRTGDDTPIKGRSMDEREAATERTSDETEEMATVLTSMDAATVLASRAAEVPTGSGSIPTTGPPAAEVPTGSDVVPTASLVFATATVMTLYRRRKGKEVMSQQRKPMTKKKKRDYYMAVIRSNLEWKEKDFRGMTFEEVEAKFNSVWKQMEDFIPMRSKEEAERIKRKGLNLEQESAKKQKTSEEVPEEAMSPEEVSEEKKITRLGGSSAGYQFFIDLLKHLDREDLIQLWGLVKETFSNRPPTSVKEMKLWVELNRMYELNDEDQLWTHTKNFMHAPIEWKLYDSCGVHQVTSKDKEIFILVEKDYPLRKGLALVMISYKLQVENYSQMANDLILKIYKITNSLR